MQYYIDSIEQIKKEFEAVRTRAEILFKNLSDEQFNFKPAPDKWSAAECVEHLNLTGGGYLKNIRMENVYKQKDNHSSPLKYKPRFPLKKFAQATGPDTKIKMPSPKFLQASTSSLDRNVYVKFLDVQKSFIEIISQIFFVDLKNIKVKWPAFPVMNLQLGEVFIMTIAHEQRHLNQAERTLKKFSNQK